MPNYKVEFKKSAKKEFDRLPASVQRKVVEAIQFLAVNPFSDLLQIKKLKGAENLFRIRIGDYRIVYEARKSILIITVIKVGHRKDIYR